MGVYSSRTNSPIKSSKTVRALPPASSTVVSRTDAGRSAASGAVGRTMIATARIVAIIATGFSQARRPIPAPPNVAAHFGHRTANRQAPNLAGAA